jgi:hypothetical protein
MIRVRLVVIALEPLDGIECIERFTMLRRSLGCIGPASPTTRRAPMTAVIRRQVSRT